MNFDSPIFIVGMPRSGTTLLQSLLNQHKDIAIAPETHFLTSHLDQYPSPEECLKEYVTTNLFSNLNVSAQQLQTLLSENDTLSYKMIFESMLMLYAKKHDKKIIGEKTPGHYEYLDKLLEWYPNGKVLWVVRDPRAVAASYQHVPWGVNSVAGPALRWRGSMQEHLKWEADRRIYTVRYEQLVEDTEGVLEAIFLHLNLETPPFDQISKKRSEGWVDLERSGSWEQKHFSLAAAPVSIGSIKKWKDELSESQIAAVECLTKVGMKKMGYTMCSKHKLKGGIIAATEVLKVIIQDPKLVARKVGIIN